MIAAPGGELAVCEVEARPPSLRHAGRGRHRSRPASGAWPRPTCRLGCGPPRSASTWPPCSTAASRSWTTHRGAFLWSATPCVPRRSWTKAPMPSMASTASGTSGGEGLEHVDEVVPRLEVRTSTPAAWARSASRRRRRAAPRPYPPGSGGRQSGQVGVEGGHQRVAQVRDAGRAAAISARPSFVHRVDVGLGHEGPAVHSRSTQGDRQNPAAGRIAAVPQREQRSDHQPAAGRVARPPPPCRGGTRSRGASGRRPRRRRSPPGGGARGPAGSRRSAPGPGSPPPAARPSPRWPASRGSSRPRGGRAPRRRRGRCRRTPTRRGRPRRRRPAPAPSGSGPPRPWPPCPPAGRGWWRSRLRGISTMAGAPGWPWPGARSAPRRPGPRVHGPSPRGARHLAWGARTAPEAAHAGPSRRYRPRRGDPGGQGRRRGHRHPRPARQEERRQRRDVAGAARRLHRGGRLEDDRVLVITGAGGAFCSGPTCRRPAVGAPPARRHARDRRRGPAPPPPAKPTIAKVGAWRPAPA